MTTTQICSLALSHMGSKALVDLDTDLSQEAIICRTWYASTRDEMLRSHPWNFATKRARSKITYTSLTGSAITDSSGVFKITSVAHGLVTGDRVLLQDVAGLTSNINTNWFITRLTADTFTLDDSEYVSGYTTGTGKFVKVPTFDFNYFHTPPTDMLRILSLENKQDIFSFESNKILANDEEILIRYIAQITDTTLWPADFTNAFSYLLASNIAQAINGPAGEGINYRKIYEQMIVPMTKIRDSREGREKLQRTSEYSDLVNSRGGFGV